MSLRTDPVLPDARVADLALLQARADGAALRLAGLSQHLRDAAATPAVTRAPTARTGALVVLGLAGLMLLVA